MDTVFGEGRMRALKAKGVIAVMVIDDPDDAIPAAKALIEGGVTTMELTLRTPAAMIALERIIGDVPDMMAGVGTILTPAQVHAAKDAKGDFGVAPGLNERVVKEAMKVGLPFAPGISTASEIESSVELGCQVLKFFPAESLGGLKYLEAINNPYGFLDLQYIPLGGLNAQNLAAWLGKEFVLAVGGSWIASVDLIKRKAWDRIQENAAQAMKIFHDVRG